MSLFQEFRRRKVFRVAVAYAALAWLVIQLVETIMPLFGFGDAPARIVVIVAAVGFIPALALAWAFELTPGGLRPDSGEPLPEAEAPGTGGSRLDRAIMVVLALAVGYFALDKFLLNAGREATVHEPVAAGLQAPEEIAPLENLAGPSIAVLAFDDMSQNRDQAYLSDGLAEELLNLLARIPELRVISRSSAFSYKGKQVKLDQIARELRVTHVLEGSVRQSGDRVRVTAQLIDARTDSHLWSQTYDRTLDDIFAVQDEIAAAVVKQLELTLLQGVPSTPDIDPEAYALLLQARYLARQGTAEGYRQSIELYRQALALVPDYPAAWVGLATNYSNQANKSLRDPAEGYSLAREAALRALAIDPAYAPALAHLGWIAMLFDKDLAGAAGYLEQALALEPGNLAIIGNAASLLYTLGRVDDSIGLDEYVARHDPVNPTGYANLAEGYLALGRLPEAIAAYETALRLSPERLAVHYYVGVARLLQGERTKALQEMEQEQYDILRMLGLAMAHHALGDAARSDALLAEVERDYAADAAYNIAYVLAFRGEPDRAFEWLQKAAEYDDPGLSDIASEPLFEPLRGDPRWEPFLASIGKAPVQLDAIPFKVTRPPLDGPPRGGAG